MHLFLAALLSGPVLGVSIESAKKSSKEEADERGSNRRVARFGVQDVTSTVFV